jgi:hypothetical protein
MKDHPHDTGEKQAAKSKGMRKLLQRIKKPREAAKRRAERKRVQISRLAIDHLDDIVWKKVNLEKLNFEGPDWDPVKFPLPERPELQLPDGMLQYSLQVGFPEDLIDDVRYTIQNAIEGGFPDHVLNIPSFSKTIGNDTQISLPKIEFIDGGKNGDQYITFQFATLEQAAFFRRLERLAIWSRSNEAEYLLFLRDAGRCHSSDLVAIEIAPIKLYKTSGLESCKDVVVSFLERFPELQLVGAWQKRQKQKYNYAKEDWDTRPLYKIMIVVKPKAGFKLDMLPGRGDSKGVFNRGSAHDLPPILAGVLTAFKLQDIHVDTKYLEGRFALEKPGIDGCTFRLAYRVPYCEDPACKSAIHGEWDCPNRLNRETAGESKHWTEQEIIDQMSEMEKCCAKLLARNAYRV